jgi:MtN3 and saliva related transmembrane protein
MEFDIHIIGYLAGICTAASQFPQAYKVYKTKQTEGISMLMYSILTLGVAFWFTYGILLNNLPMILANGACLPPALYTLYVMMKNQKNKL